MFSKFVEFSVFLWNKGTAIHVSFSQFPIFIYKNTLSCSYTYSFVFANSTFSPASPLGPLSPASP